MVRNWTHTFQSKKKVTKTTTENVEDIRFDTSNFGYNEENDEFICPENQRLKFLCEGHEKEKRKKYRIYKGTECKKCELSKSCTKRKDGIRRLKIADFSKERKQLADKMVIIQLPLFLTYFSATLNADNFHIDYYKIIARVSLEA